MTTELTIAFTLHEVANFIGYDLPDEVMLGAFERVVNQLYDTMQREANLRRVLNQIQEEAIRGVTASPSFSLGIISAIIGQAQACSEYSGDTK